MIDQQPTGKIVPADFHPKLIDWLNDHIECHCIVHGADAATPAIPPFDRRAPGKLGPVTLHGPVVELRASNASIYIALTTEYCPVGEDGAFVPIQLTDVASVLVAKNEAVK